MAEKATLMLDAAKKGEEIKRLEAAIAKCNEDIETLPQSLEQDKRAAREKALAAFDSRQDELRDRVTALCDAKKKEIEDYIDSVPGMEAREYAGKLEVTAIEDQLKTIYPEEMITDYLCTGTVEIDEPEEAFAMYAEAEMAAANLSNGSDFMSKMFNSLTDLLVSMCENPNLGMKVIPIVLLFYALGVLFLPFVFLTAFTLIGVFSAIQGASVKRLIKKIYSVKQFLNASYNKDVFNKQKTTLMRGVDAFLHDVRQDYFDEIAKNQFEYDGSIDAKMDKKVANAVKKAKQDRDLYNSQLEKVQKELQELLERIAELDEEDKKKAESARKDYLETITWKYEWLQHLLVDITADNRKVLLPFSRANSIYFSKDVENLKEFSRLVVLQCALHMHPEYASQAVIDYKYMGGGLTQFISLEGKAVGLFFTESEISAKVENVDKEIMARTKSILASSPDLDSFNELMHKYESAGEFYVLMHIFGLESISNVYRSWLRNGPRVGYIFKLYLTIDELAMIGSDLPFDDFKDYFEINNIPTPRTAAAVKRIIGSDS